MCWLCPRQTENQYSVLYFILITLSCLLMTIFQILIFIFVAFVIGKAIVRLAKKEISAALFCLWAVFWLVIALVAFFPATISWLAALVGVGRGVDLAIYIAIFVLFYIIFKMNSRLNKIEKNISEIVRKNAFGSHKKF